MTKRDECCMSYCCVFRMETVLRNGVSVRYLGVGAAVKLGHSSLAIFYANDASACTAQKLHD